MNQITKTQTDINVPLWTALITPFDASGQVDFDTLTNIARHQADANNGILLLGSTGEGLALTPQEQLAVVEHVCSLSLSVPIMVGVGGYQLPQQIDWIKACNQLPIAAYLLSTPLYAKPGAVGLTQWFSALLDASAFPCMVYNVPSRSGVNIPITTIQAIQSHQHCWSMKEASGDLNTFLGYREHCTEIDLYSGEDAMMPYLAGANVKGLVSVAANAWPSETRLYVELALQGKHETLFPVWQQAVDALFQVANPIPVKKVMEIQGRLAGAVLRAPLTLAELAANNNLDQINQLVEGWYENAQSQISGVK